MTSTDLPGPLIGVRALATIGAILLAAWPATAASATAPLQLALGHAARQELCFNVSAPGPVRIVVSSDSADERLHVTLYAGQDVVATAQGQGRVSIEAQADARTLARGREWAVVVSGASREVRLGGRIDAEFPDPAGGARHAVEAWLLDHPTVAWHLVWNERGRPLTYSAWPDQMQRRLWSAVEDARAGRSTMPDPPPNAWQVQPGDDPTAVHTAFEPNVAGDMYVTTVAQVLLLEIDRRVPWSLTDLNGDELEALVASTSLFWWNPAQQAYEISEFDHGWAVPAAPGTAWRFLQDERLMGTSRLDTITRLVGWARRLTQVAGPVSRANFQEHWGYDGDMPVARALSGTRYSGTAFRSLPGYGLERHYTAGCHGTAGLLVSVLRAAGVPARLRTVSNQTFSHATIVFLSEDRALSHGDDPYAQLAEDADPAALLIDLATYERWLGPGAKDAGRHIGRQAAALGLQNLPPVVRRAFEMDRARGDEPAQSAVFALFRDTHTLDELREARLWERLAGAPGAIASAATVDGGWLEAETMKASVTAGTAEAQSMEAFTSGNWRGNGQLRWHGASPGAELTLPFDVAADGRYQLFVRFTRAPDAAIVAIRLDEGSAALDRVSLYAPFVLAADPLPLGEHALAAGRHTLRLTIMGAHPQATPAFTVGIDAVRLVPTR